MKMGSLYFLVRRMGWLLCVALSTVTNSVHH